MDSQWMKERLQNLFIYGTIILAIGFGLYKIFLQPTNKTNNVYSADSRPLSLLESSRISPFSCARIVVAK
ncbi:MAG: hypothetical protein BWY74_02892 [Firmicutes bacterium ADurb.Bin419]|jgi:hypothetical protein|nr:MAG: hypothetical protein BWY74_02892 [Firmicutes bacterium ADurb.Bin419]